MGLLYLLQVFNRVFLLSVSFHHCLYSDLLQQRDRVKPVGLPPEGQMWQSRSIRKETYFCCTALKG